MINSLSLGFPELLLDCICLPSWYYTPSRRFGSNKAWDYCGFDYRLRWAHSKMAGGAQSPKCLIREDLQLVGENAPGGRLWHRLHLYTSPTLLSTYPHSHQEQAKRACWASSYNEPEAVRSVMQACTRGKNVVLMEAMWTRYLPATQYFQKELLPKIGQVKRVYAKFSFPIYSPNMLLSSRFLDKGARA